MLDFLQKQRAENESYWAVLIEPEWITSSVWQIEDGKVKVVTSSNSTRWEDNILTSIDTSLSACMQNLPEDFKDPEKTVFGLPSSWINGGNIKEEHLSTLKKVCDELSLSPSGFVVLSEGIANYYKVEEGSGLSGVVVGISDQNLEVSIFNMGNLVGVTNVARSISIEDDLTEGLVRLSGDLENISSRIVLFNQKEQELEDVKEVLNNADWAKIGANKFIHTPRVEVFNPENKIIAISLAGGLELGAKPEIINDVTEDKDEKVEQDEVKDDYKLEEVQNFEEAKDITPSDLGFSVEPIEEKVAQEIKMPKIVMPTLPKFDGIKVNISKFNLPKLNFLRGNKTLMILGIATISFLFFGLLIWWVYPKAVVTVYVSPKTLEENLDIDLSSSDIESQEVEVEIEKEKSRSTTGTKTVGEKAKGQVKIQNGTAFPINLSAGSVLTSSGDLKFVTLSSASVSGALSPTEPGISIISVEANAIGSEYNLGKDEVFKVSNYPKAEVDASSLESFSGGSSRQISSVSEEDRKKLLESLEEEILDEAKSKLSEKITINEFLIDESIKTKILNQDFSNKLGDEATTLSLTLKLKIIARAISKTSLAKISRQVLESKIPEDFILRDDQLSYEFIESDENLDTRVKANLLPNLDPNEIAKKIAGKYPSIAEEYLKSVAGFVKAEFRIKPMFPSKFGTLPHLVKNISVEFSADK